MAHEMGSKFSVDTEVFDDEDYCIQPISSITSTDSDERALSKINLFPCVDVDDQESYIDNVRSPSFLAYNQIDQKHQSSQINLTEGEQGDKSSLADKPEPQVALLSLAGEVKIVSQLQEVSTADAADGSTKDDGPHLAQEILMKKQNSADSAQEICFQIQREAGDVQGPYSATEIQDLFRSENSQVEKLESAPRVPMSNKDEDLNNNDLPPVAQLNDLVENMYECELNVLSQQNEENIKSGLKGISDYDDSTFNGDSECEADCLAPPKLTITNSMRKSSHSYFEFTYGEQKIPKNPPYSPPFSEISTARTTQELVITEEHVSTPESDENTSKAPKTPQAVGLFSKAKHAFRPITPFVDCTDLNPSSKIDNLHIYLKHVEKRQIEMCTAWSLIKACDKNESFLELPEVQELRSNCKMFKHELKLRIDWLLKEVSKLQSKLQRLSSHKQLLNNSMADATDIFSMSTGSNSFTSGITSSNELQLEILRSPHEDKSSEVKQPNQPLQANVKKPKSLNDALKKACDDKREEYLQSLKAYIDHDFESYKTGCYNAPDDSFRNRHSKARLLFGQEALGDFYYQFLS